MLTDIIQTITYTFDTKVLPPYDADTDWTKAACTSPSMKPKQVSSTGSAIMRAKSTPASTGTGYSKTMSTSSVS